MKWIGLTGGIGSGKSTVAEILKENGVSVVDADVVAREVTQKTGPGFSPVVQEFGQEILNAQGELDRRKIAEIVFRDPKKLLKLEAILHPLVGAEVKKRRAQLESKGCEFAVYDVPLLFEKKLNTQFDAVVVVNCSLDTQIKRTVARSGLTEREVRDRIAAQVPLSEKVKQADYVIENEGSLAELKIQVSELSRKLS